MYAKKVTCFGSPFYSGWELTDDRDVRDEKVTKNLSLEQLFYGAYIEYHKYVLGSCEDTVVYIDEQLQKN